VHGGAAFWGGFGRRGWGASSLIFIDSHNRSRIRADCRPFAHGTGPTMRVLHSREARSGSAAVAGATMQTLRLSQ
jgi:hypothetical protein